MRQTVNLRVRESGHDPGRVAVDLAVMLADGGEAIADLAVLRNQSALFGPVASDPTAWRLLSNLDAAVLARLRQARARARELDANRDQGVRESGAGWLFRGLFLVQGMVPTMFAAINVRLVESQARTASAWARASTVDMAAGLAGTACFSSSSVTIISSNFPSPPSGSATQLALRIVTRRVASLAPGIEFAPVPLMAVSLR